MKFHGICFLVMFFFVQTALAGSGYKAYRHNKQGNWEIVDPEKFPESIQSYAKALGEEPLNARIHFNLAMALIKNQKSDEGLKELALAEKLAGKDRLLQFAIQFNTAKFYGDMKNVGKALEHYQRALDINPGSKEVKTNIELLMKEQKQKGNNSSKGDRKSQKQEASSSKDKDSQDKGSKGQDQAGQSKSNLSKKDIENVLQEIENQEKKIRAKQRPKKSGRSSRGKAW